MFPEDISFTNHLPSPDQLRDICSGEVLEFFKLAPLSRRYHILEWFLRPVGRKFAKTVTQIEQDVAVLGMQQSAAKLHSAFLRTLEVHGTENIPPSGPLILASNHPGGADILALISQTPRSDMVVAVNDRPVLRVMPNLRPHMVFISRDKSKRLSTMQGLISALRLDQCVMLFPTGTADPDPAFIPGSLHSIQSWSKSLSALLERLPQVPLVPVIISGVLSQRAWDNLLVRLGKTQKRRQQYALILQTIFLQLFPRSFPVDISMTFFPRFHAPSSKTDIHQAILDYVSECYRSLSLCA